MPLEDYYRDRVHCDHEVWTRGHKLLVEPLLWETFGIHPCDQGELYEVIMFPICILFVILGYFCLIRWAQSVQDNGYDFVCCCFDTLGYFIYDLSLFLVGLAVKAIIVLIWIVFCLPQIVRERWDVNWKEWMDVKIPGAPQAPSPAPESTPDPQTGTEPEPEPELGTEATPIPTPFPVPSSGSRHTHTRGSGLVSSPVPSAAPLGPTPTPPISPPPSGSSQSQDDSGSSSSSSDDDDDAPHDPILTSTSRSHPLPLWLYTSDNNIGIIDHRRPLPIATRPATIPVLTIPRPPRASLVNRPTPAPQSSAEVPSLSREEQSRRRNVQEKKEHVPKGTFTLMDNQIAAQAAELRLNRSRIEALKRQLASALAAPPPPQQPQPKDVLSDDKVAIERSRRQQAEQQARATEVALKKQILEKDDALEKATSENAALKDVAAEKDAAIKNASEENAALQKASGEKDAAMQKISDENAALLKQVMIEKDAQILDLDSQLKAAIAAKDAAEADAAGKKTSAEGEKKGLEASSEALRNELLDSQRTRERLEQEAEALRQENESLRKRTGDSEKSKDALALENKENCARAAKLEADVEATKATAEALHGEKMAPMEKERTELLQRLEKAEKALLDSQQRCESLQAEGQKVQNERDAARTQIQAQQAPSGPDSAQLRQELGNLQARFNTGAAQYNRLTEEYKRLQAHLGEMDKTHMAEQRQKASQSERMESLTRTNQDLNNQVATLRSISQQAVREAVADANKEIRQLRAQLKEAANGAGAAPPQTPMRTPANGVVNRSTPSSTKSFDASLFSAGPRKIALSPNAMGEAARAALANQRDKQMASMSVQLQNYARDNEAMENERDAALDKIDEQAEELAALRRELDATKQATQEQLDDLEETIAMYEAGFENDQEKDALDKQEQARELQNVRDQLNATKSVLADQSARLQGGTQGTKRVPSTNLTRTDSQLKKTKTVAESLLQRDLPGGYDRISTSGEGLLCGIRAIIASVAAQHPDIPQPTEKELVEIVNSQHYRDEARQFGGAARSNFRADQLDGFVHWYYDSFDYNVSVGVVAQGQAPFLPGGDSDEQGDRLLVWIHNDNAVDRTGAAFNHWEGLAPRRPAAQPAPFPAVLPAPAPAPARDAVARIDNAPALKRTTRSPEASDADAAMSPPPSPTRRIAKCRAPHTNAAPLRIEASPFQAQMRLIQEEHQKQQKKDKEEEVVVVVSEEE